jgi:DhnA family fructose-bisphosphate aldolase class Ia
MDLEKEERLQQLYRRRDHLVSVVTGDHCTAAQPEEHEQLEEILADIKKLEAEKAAQSK